MMKKPTVSTRARNLLKRIDASEDGELVREKGAGWWVDADQVAARDAVELLRFVLLKRTYSSNDESYETFGINEEGRCLLGDPLYVPEIVEKMAEELTRGADARVE